MWNVIAANRLLDKRSRQKQYIKHRKTLTCIKSQIDNLPPPSFDFLTSRPKTKLINQQKHQEIQANNQDLVRRIIQPRNQPKGASGQAKKHSLHANYFKHRASAIERDNMKLVQRLAGATSFLNFGRMEIDHRRHLRWKEAHRKPADISTTRPLSAR